MKELFKKHYILITVIIIIIVLLVVVFFAGKKYGENSTAPEIPGDNPNNPLTDQEKAAVKSIGDRLQEDIYDWDGGAFRDWDAYNELATASDKIFVAVYNYYKGLTGVSLKVDMQGESYWIDQNPLSQTNIIQLIFNRFAGLKLP